MKLIVDSGSTKTEWRYIGSDGVVSQSRSNGINPYYQDTNTIQSEIKSGIENYLKEDIKEVYFYGAGCSSTENIKKIRDSFLFFFPSANININHDLLAAAHALCGHEKGIACILGTGSNSCLYDGEKIIENIPSLGYILGDEGSGNYLGRKLLIDFSRGDLPDIISEKLIKRFGISIQDILQNVYQNEMPVRYLAKFSKFIFQNLKEPYLYHLVYDAFTLFFQKNIMKYSGYQNVPVHFTGSVAFYYSNILRKVAADNQVTLKHIVENPIAGLTLYYE